MQATQRWAYRKVSGKNQWTWGPFLIQANYGGPITTFDLFISNVYQQWFASREAAEARAESIAIACKEALDG